MANASVPPPDPPSGGARDPNAAREVLARVERLAAESERLFLELRAGEERYRRIARAVWSVQEEERRRIARELHDGIGQLLTAVKQRLEPLLEAGEAATEDPLGQALELTRRALAETRQLSRLLRPPMLDDLGLEATLRWLCRSLGEPGTLAVELETEGLEARLPPELETLAFRVAQEALTNVVRHSGAERARLLVAASRELLVLEISDDGCGYDPDSEANEHPGSGITGMRDRVAIFGGRLTIDSSPRGGTKVRAEVPIAAGEGRMP